MDSFVLALMGVTAVFGLPIFFYMRKRRGLASEEPYSVPIEGSRPSSAFNTAQSFGQASGNFPPRADFPHRWYHWLLAFFTAGMTLIFTLPTAFSKRGATQRKIDSLWRKYLDLKELAGQPLAGFHYLFNADYLESKQNGVFLQEARTGDTTTKTDGTISLKGNTSTGGVGLAIGPIGLGGAESFSRMKGTMESTGTSSQGKDRAVDIDDGQLRLLATGLRFVGKLQVRDIPVKSMIQIGVDQDVLIVASAASSLAQRFRFGDSFEANVFGRVASMTMETGSFPNLEKFRGEIAGQAVEYRSSQIAGLQEQMRKVARG